MSDTTSLLKTPLYEQHKALNARIVDFGGWALPVNYSSQISEHNAVRNNVGMFDVSHMTVSDITGEDTIAFLSSLLANDIAKITSTPGKALYSCMLNPTGGVMDDLIVYYLHDQHCRIVTNAGTRAKDMAWLQKHALTHTDVTVTEKPDLALIAVQGPNALTTLRALFTKTHASLGELVAGLARFQGGFDTTSTDNNQNIFIGRTGYTGEDGVEMIVPANQAPSMWQMLEKAGVTPCGLGARDTLRLEAGMALYGSDLDDAHTPLDSGLSWTVAMKDKREFIGRQALEKTATYKMIGLILEDKGVLRGHQPLLYKGEDIGEITSGTHSPTLKYSIALARVKNDPRITVDTVLQVQIRNKWLTARVVKYPFLK